MNISQLRKNRSQQLKDLQEKLNKENQSSGYVKDERIWKPKFNKEKGSGTCIVRFLSPKVGDPFVQMQTNSFRTERGNFWENALQTIGAEDPVQIAAISCFRKAKNTGDTSYKDLGKTYLPKSKFYANILVIKDEEEPENEGKVFVYEFGFGIYNFIKSKLNPEFEDMEVMSPFDFWEGANFRIRMIGKEIPDFRNPGKKVMVPNYDKSSFDPVTALFDGDEDKLQEVYDQTYDLSEFVSADKFKSFEEIAKRFESVTGRPYNWLSDEGVEASATKTSDDLVKTAKEQFDDDSIGDNKEESTTTEKDEPPFDMDDDDDDPVARFRALAQQS